MQIFLFQASKVFMWEITESDIAPKRPAVRYLSPSALLAATRSTTYSDTEKSANVTVRILHSFSVFESVLCNSLFGNLIKVFSRNVILFLEINSFWHLRYILFVSSNYVGISAKTCCNKLPLSRWYDMVKCWKYTCHFIHNRTYFRSFFHKTIKNPARS